MQLPSGLLSAQDLCLEWLVLYYTHKVVSKYQQLCLVSIISLLPQI